MYVKTYGNAKEIEKNLDSLRVKIAWDELGHQLRGGRSQLAGLHHHTVACSQGPRERSKAQLN